MGSLTVNLGDGELELPEDVHFLLRAGQQLIVTPTPPAEEGRSNQLGFFVPVLDQWYFRVESIPAARALRIDGGPVTNARQRLRTDRTTVVRLASRAATGPRRTRTPVVGQVATPPVRPGGKAPADGRPDARAPRYVIGRAGTNADIPIDDPLVRARHATVRIDSQGRWWISGELYVNGVRQMSATLAHGDVFVIGQTAVTVSPDLLPGRARTAAPPEGVREVTPGIHRRPTTETGLAVRLDHVTVYGNNGRKRLDDVTLDIAPGEVVAVVGPSGAGKSSLIKVLMGELAEDAGSVRLGPDSGPQTDPEVRRRQVRYVPQGDEDLFKPLTARQTLTYAACLRAASDTTDVEIKDRVNDVLRRLGLDQPSTLADQSVEKLSGGQRRRVSIGMELVGSPRLLLLDEPTSGLDAGKDRAIMADLRELGRSYPCTVIVVTHATEHLGYVDKVVVIARGGRVRDAGPPATVLRTLGHATWADLMDELDREPPADPARTAPPAARRPYVPPARLAVKGLPTLLHRQFTLTRRRRPGSLAVMVAVPVASTFLAVVAARHGLRPSASMSPVMAILVTVAALTGASLTYPDIVSDSGKLHRDWRVGVEAFPMLLAKATVYSGVCVVLAAAISVVFAAFQELPPRTYGVPPFAMLYLVLLLTMLASMGAGLFISACSPTLERAVTWSTLLAVLQVALGGTLFHLKGAVGVVTCVVPARVGVAAIASYADLNSHRRPALYTDWLWDPGVRHFWWLAIALLAIFATAVAGSVPMLHRRWTR